MAATIKRSQGTSVLERRPILDAFGRACVPVRFANSEQDYVQLPVGKTDSSWQDRFNHVMQNLVRLQCSQEMLVLNNLVLDVFDGVLRRWLLDSRTTRALPSASLPDLQPRIEAFRAALERGDNSRIQQHGRWLAAHLLPADHTSSKQRSVDSRHSGNI